MKNLFIAFVLVIGLMTSAQAQVALGVGAQYTPGFDGTFGLQANALVGISEKLDISPSFTYFFSDDADYAIDADLHYNLLVVGDAFSFSPFAGINYLAGTDNNIGFNLGLSLQIKTENGAIYLEPKYMIDNFEDFVFTAGYFF